MSQPPTCVDAALCAPGDAHSAGLRCIVALHLRRPTVVATPRFAVPVTLELAADRASRPAQQSRNLPRTRATSLRHHDGTALFRTQMTVVLTHATSSSEVLHLSLETAVTFFVPAKKVTRSSVGGVEALAFSAQAQRRAVSKESYPLLRRSSGSFGSRRFKRSSPERYPLLRRRSGSFGSPRKVTRWPKDSGSCGLPKVESKATPKQDPPS